MVKQRLSSPISNVQFSQVIMKTAFFSFVLALAIPATNTFTFLHNLHSISAISQRGRSMTLQALPDKEYLLQNSGIDSSGEKAMAGFELLKVSSRRLRLEF